MKDAGLSKS
jgi:heat shock 70kDa protein 1/2/6/8